MRRTFRFLNGQRIEFDANGDRTPGPSGIPGGKEPRIVADAAYFLGRDAHLKRKAASLFDFFRVPASYELRRDELRSVRNREARAAKGFREPRRRDEFAPARFGRAVNVAPCGDEICGLNRIDPPREQVRAIHQIGDARFRRFLCFGFAAGRFSRKRLGAPGSRAPLSAGLKGRRLNCLISG